MNDKFKSNLAKFYAIAIIVLLLLISLNSCKKQKIEPEPEAPKIRVQNLRTGANGMIEKAEVLVSPLEGRFIFIEYNLIGRDDGFEGNIVFEKSFSDTIDLKYEENLIGNKTFAVIYEELENVYSLETENEQVKILK